ncbi:class I SAM-dependent methyltransferase [Hymenobacter sp. HD11105]
MLTPIANTYGWKSAQAEHSHSYLLPATTSYLKKYKVQSLLDIGTGNGSTLPHWLSQGIKVAAIEPDNEGFSLASQHNRADVRKLGVGDAIPAEWRGAFDGIVCLEVIEHLFDPVQLVNTVNIALSKGGVLIISTPYHGYIKNVVLAIAGKWDFHHHPKRVGGHIKFWSRNSLTSLLNEAGYEECSFKGVGRFPYLWKSMIMVFKKRA